MSAYDGRNDVTIVFLDVFLDVFVWSHSRRPAVLESIIDGSDRVSCPKADGLSVRRLRGYQLPLAAPQDEMESAK
jgi:hypothetical protein